MKRRIYRIMGGDGTGNSELLETFTGTRREARARMRELRTGGRATWLDYIKPAIPVED